jgi:hypothetical protein
VDVEVEEVGDAGAGDRDREGQRPVGERAVATGPELEGDPDDDGEDLEAAAAEVAVVLQEVRGDLAAGGSQDLHHPEEGDDLRDLRGDGRRKEPADPRQLGFA